MAKYGTRSALPIDFRNVDDKSADLATVLMAPGIEIGAKNPNVSVETILRTHMRSCPDSVILTMKDEVCESPLMILEYLLHPERYDLKLWRVQVAQQALTLSYASTKSRDATTIRGFTAATIHFSMSDYFIPLELIFTMPETSKKPASKLFCGYEIDAAWGTFVRVVELSRDYILCDATSWSFSSQVMFERLLSI